MSTASIKETLLQEVSTLPPDRYSEVLNFIESLKVDKPKTASGKRPRSELCGWLKDKVWMADDFDAPLEEPNKSLRKPRKPGCMRGEIWMADDFDAPLEEFEEYM